MKLLPVGKEEQQFFDVSISKRELQSILAMGGHISGSGEVRHVFVALCHDVATVLDTSYSNSWFVASDALNTNMHGSLQARRKEK